MSNALRLVVLGDPHVQSNDIDLWAEAIEDLNALKPDAVLVLGDLTGGNDTGSPAQLKEAVALLDRFDAPWRSIIGNHDLQWEGYATDSEAVADFLREQQRSTPWFRWDLPGLSVLGLSNTRWRENPVTPNEIVLVDEQLDWWEAQLTELADTPVLVVCHTPPVGSGLLHMPELHAQVGNALVNQNHQPNRITRLLWEHPNVLFWFSGHNHLGQHYRDALSIRLGIHFAHTGVVGRHSRDGFRHSRVLDLAPGRITLETFDHTTRRLDPALRYRDEHDLRDWLNYRHNHLRHRRVAMDPQTMAQGPGPGPVQRGEKRFAFFSDAHWVEPALPLQRRVIGWGLQQVRAFGAGDLVLGGDLTHHADAKACQLVLRQVVGQSLRIHYLPGNNEGPFTAMDPQAGAVAADHHGVTWIRQRVHPLTDWPGAAWALVTTCLADASEAIRELVPQLPRSGACLVFAHFPPSSADPAACALLEEAECRIHWICGHKHGAKEQTTGSLQVTLVGGLDPIKVRDQRPDVLLGVWTGQALRLERREVPTAMLLPSRSRGHRAGVACFASPQSLLDDALERDIPALQFRKPAGEVSPEVRERIERFRARQPEGLLSVHLPNPGEASDAEAATALAASVDWARSIGADDWTIHLPALPAGVFFGPDRAFRQTPLVQDWLERYLALARQALAAGATLSLENVNNKGGVSGPEEELLSCRPWHLRCFVTWLRDSLQATGTGAEQARRVGVIFDSGHAFTDPVVSKDHGLGDWIFQLRDLIQLAHVHQCVACDTGGYRRHQGIDSAIGSRINHLGLVSLLEEMLPRPIVLLAEVREREAALTSVKTLQDILRQIAEVA